MRQDGSTLILLLSLLCAPFGAGTAGPSSSIRPPEERHEPDPSAARPAGTGLDPSSHPHPHAEETIEAPDPGGEEAPTPPPRGSALVPPQLEPLIARALREHPRVARTRERLRAAQARTAAAGALEDPTASLSYLNDTVDSLTLGTSEFSQAVLSWSQPLPGRGKRALERKRSRLSAAAIEPLIRRAEMDLRRDILRAWWSLALELETRSLLIEERDLLDHVESLTRDRYSLGLARQDDVLRAQVEKTRLAEALLFSDGAIDALRDELRGLLLVSFSDPLPEPGPLPLLPEPPLPATAVEDALARSPEIEAIERAGSAAEARVAIARQDYRPDYTLGGSYMFRGSLDPMIAVSVGVRLPMFRKTRLDPGLEAASGDLSEARAAAADMAILVRTRTLQRSRALRTARESARLLEEVLVPRDRLAFDAALASYRTGRIEGVTLLGSLAAILRDKLEVSRRLFQAAIESVEMDAVSLDVSWGSASRPAWAPTIGAPMGPDLPLAAASEPNAPSTRGGSSMGGMP